MRDAAPLATSHCTSGSSLRHGLPSFWQVKAEAALRREEESSEAAAVNGAIFSVISHLRADVYEQMPLLPDEAAAALRHALATFAAVSATLANPAIAMPERGGVAGARGDGT